MIDKIKRMHKSVTIWFNVVAASVYAALPVMLENFPMLQGYVPDRWYHYAMGAVVMGNFVLRFKTSQPLQEK